MQPLKQQRPVMTGQISHTLSEDAFRQRRWSFKANAVAPLQPTPPPSQNPSKAGSSIDLFKPDGNALLYFCDEIFNI